MISSSSSSLAVSSLAATALANACNLDGFTSAGDLLSHVQMMAINPATPRAYVAYGKQKAEAMTARAGGKIGLAMACEGAADRAYGKLPPGWAW